jgi:hypothetical protein
MYIKISAGKKKVRILVMSIVIVTIRLLMLRGKQMTRAIQFSRNEYLKIE